MLNEASLPRIPTLSNASRIAPSCVSVNPRAVAVLRDGGACIGEHGAGLSRYSDW